MTLVLHLIYESKVTNKPDIYKMFSIYAYFPNNIVLFRDKRPSIIDLVSWKIFDDR